MPLVEWEKKPLVQVADLIMGQSPPSDSYNSDQLGLPFFQGKTDFGKLNPIAKLWCTNPTRRAQKGDILMSVRAPVGPTNISDLECCIGRGLASIRPLKTTDQKYLYYFFKFFEPQIENLGTGSTFKAITKSTLANLQIPLPDLPTQKHIAAVLDEADRVRTLLRDTLGLYDELVQSVFLEMFGDPVLNEKGWEVKKIKNVTTIFRDGPFGSNLKSEHYIKDYIDDEGIYSEINIGNKKSPVRVIRLQNVGVGDFNNSVSAFVSYEHYETTLSKHTCLPGDILIATMGEPNIRAVILPDFIEFAVNKADCLQCRVDDSKTNAIYLKNLINFHGFIVLVSHLRHGQTRTRISMGGLKEVSIPMPNISLQNNFAEIAQSIQSQKAQTQSQLAAAEDLYAGLLQGYFG